MNLQLSLKAKWFEMTKAGIKTEDYREITPYWVRRLINVYFLGIKYKMGTLEMEQFIFLLKTGVSRRPKVKDDKPFIWEWKCFTTNTMTLGYPRATDSTRILKIEHKGIEIKTGNPEWGAEPNKIYFVIKHGLINDLTLKTKTNGL